MALWRTPRKNLTDRQESDARAHYSRLLRRWPNASPHLKRLLWGRARCLALHPERFTSEHGARMMRQREAKATNRIIRAQGRTPGDEGRAVIQRNRMARRLKPFTDMGWRMPRP